MKYFFDYSKTRFDQQNTTFHLKQHHNVHLDITAIIKNNYGGLLFLKSLNEVKRTNFTVKSQKQEVSKINMI